MKIDAKKLGRLAFFDSADIGTEPPEKFMLLKFGVNRLTKGGENVEFDFSEKDADLIMSDFADRGKDLVIDYEHQTLKGVEAPAAGWIDKLEKTTDGLVAKVKCWTDKAASYLRAREYRYHSPVVDFSRRKAALHSVALTNHPALHGFPALVADDMECGEMGGDGIDITKTHKMEMIMNHLKAIASALGSAIPDDADETKALELVTSGIKVLQSKLAENESKMAGMVAMTDLENAKKEIATLKAAQAVKAAIAEGRLCAEQEESAVRIAMTDMEAFEKLIASAKIQAKDERPKAPAGTVDATVAQPVKDGVLAMSDDEVKVYKSMGLSEKQIEAIKIDKKK